MKIIRDPLYGYIEIDEDSITLIDTAEFQRLRNIRQTGYEALYPGALHNRFVHSLGVYHLGRKAMKYFRRNTEKQSGIDNSIWSIWERTFIFACLLHDVGHSPFSHTGEEFYNKIPGFRSVLPGRFESSDLMKAGKPHEVMSAIVGLDLLKKCSIEQVEEELFVRCIIGASYPKTEENLYLNAIIQMLNGTVIDVDKLDYLIRDAYETGYDSVNLDVERLLSAYTVTESENGKVTAYRRGALSVIENVTYANDLERRWIQMNPTILYDCKLLEIGIQNYNQYMKETYKKELKNYGNILCQQALSREGFQSGKLRLRLLCDDDIIAYLKNIDTSQVAEQYFERGERLVPMWKNEEDFNEIIINTLGDRVIRELKSEVAELTVGLNDIFFLNKKVKQEIGKNYKNEKELAQKTGMGEDIMAVRTRAYQNVIRMLTLFERFIKKLKLTDDEFAIISSKRYESNYKKLALENIYVELSPGRVIRFSETLAVNSVSRNEKTGKEIFYVYTTRKNRGICKANTGKDIGEVWAQFVAENWSGIYK